MRCRRIPIQGIGERGDIIRMEKEHTCECCKKKERSEKERKDMINRLSRIEGQIRGIKGMVEKHGRKRLLLPGYHHTGSGCQCGTQQF